MKTFLKVLWVIAGIVLILGGCAAFFKPFKAFVVTEVILGAALIISGIVSIIAYIRTQKHMLGAGWILAEGILSLILGLLICFSKYSNGLFAITVSTFLGLWLLFSGVSQMIRSFDLHKLGAHGWGWITAWGIICIIGGVAVFCNPVITAVGTASFLSGIVLILGGIAALARCLTRDIED